MAPTTALKLENVLYEKKDAIAYVALNRPKVLNALNKTLIEELKAVFEDARDDGRILLPFATLRLELLAAGHGKPIEARASIVF